MSVKDMLKKIFIPGYNDKKVDALNKESLKKIEESGRAAQRLKEGGLANLIIIAIGGRNHD